MEVPRLAEEAVRREDAVELRALLVAQGGGEGDAELHYAHVVYPLRALASGAVAEMVE